MDELQQAAELQPTPQRFERLLDLLDRDLRIITPTEPPPDGTQYSVLSTQESGTPLAPPGNPSAARDLTGRGRYYQLTHDFLVPALREWLAQPRKPGVVEPNCA